LFYLCRWCAVEQNQTAACTHETVAARALVGTWVLDEIRLDAQKGNRLVKMYEIYEYQVTRWEPQTREGGLFAQYIDTFLKLKAEVTGNPEHVRIAEDEGRYVREFNSSE
jgi:hypothetical protein